MSPKVKKDRRGRERLHDRPNGSQQSTAACHFCACLRVRLYVCVPVACVSSVCVRLPARRSDWLAGCQPACGHSFRLSVSLCLSVLSTCLPASVCLPCLSAGLCILPACLLVCLRVCTRASLSVYLPACLSVSLACLPECLPICLACPRACVSACLSACVSVCLFVL